MKMDLRKIDALVAEHVMGLEVQKDQITKNWYSEKTPDDKSEFFIGKSNDKIPKYSSDISAAWAIVEKVESHTFTLTAEEDKLPMWGAAFGFWNSEKQDFDLIESLADSAPLAICLAALKVSGIEPPTQSKSEMKRIAIQKGEKMW